MHLFISYSYFLLSIVEHKKNLDTNNSLGQVFDISVEDEIFLTSEPSFGITLRNTVKSTKSSTFSSNEVKKIKYG